MRHSNSPDSGARHGFSLVELVIVVVIIGVIAAIAVPRLSRGAEGADEAALKASLKNLRTAIDLYAAEHGGEYPAQDEQVSTLVDQLLGTTNAQGVGGSTPGEHIYGPYLRGMPPVSVPPYKGAQGVKFLSDGSTATAGGDEDKGWIYNAGQGHVYANSNASDAKGKPFKDY